MATYTITIETTGEQQSAIENKRAAEGKDASNEALLLRNIGLMLEKWVTEDKIYLDDQLIKNIVVLDAAGKDKVVAAIKEAMANMSKPPVK